MGHMVRWANTRGNAGIPIKGIGVACSGDDLIMQSFHHIMRAIFYKLTPFAAIRKNVPRKTKGGDLSQMA